MSEIRSKYNARPTVVDGIRFASGMEARRYQELKLMEFNGEISSVQIHPRFKLVVNECHVCDYVADFIYTDKDDMKIVEDVKGMKTPVYNLKKKLMEACYGIHIQEVKA